jgi:tetratricopeptide (TPR) repeat protein
MYRVGTNWLTRVLRDVEISDSTSSWTNYWLALLALRQRDYTGALRYAEQSLRSAAGGEHELLLGRALEARSAIYQYQGELHLAEVSATSAMECAAAYDDRTTQAAALNRLGYIQYLLGDYDRAESLFIRGLLLAQLRGDERRLACIYLNIGELAVSRSHYETADNLFRQAMRAWARLNDPFARASTLEAIALLHYRMGNHHACGLALRRAGLLLLAVGLPVLSDMIEIGALHAAGTARPEQALRLAAAAMTYRETREGESFGYSRDEYTYRIDGARAMLSAGAAAEATFAGRAISYDAAILMACGLDPPRWDSRGDRNLLTGRRRVTAALVVDALTDGETGRRRAARASAGSAVAQPRGRHRRFAVDAAQHQHGEEDGQQPDGEGGGHQPGGPPPNC